ncbi:hypothetical protein BDZ91DRAFT_329542 [Kalaharituber pfeilii]|nr:hypothetical protein BDZ91DRAFT_329542 [Kalaharituber pfeilii]
MFYPIYSTLFSTLLLIALFVSFLFPLTPHHAYFYHSPPLPSPPPTLPPPSSICLNNPLPLRSSNHETSRILPFHLLSNSSFPFAPSAAPSPSASLTARFHTSSTALLIAAYLDPCNYSSVA